MDPKSLRPKRQDDALSMLNVAIEALNLTKEVLSMTPAKAVCGSVSAILTMIRDSMSNEADYVELGLACADVCTALGRGMNGKKLDDLSQSVCDAIAQLAATVGEIQRKVIRRSGRNAVSRLFNAKNDKETIAAWKLDLNRVLHVFNTELSINTHALVLDIHRNIVTGQEGTSDQRHLIQTRVPPGELVPPPPRACFGRDEVIERIIDLAENLAPIALIGPGGIGKTSIALTVLHHSRIRERFGTNRRFIRCDQFPASRTHLLSRLSKVIGAGVENPEDLTPLRPLLSSTEMILFLDNAESILDPQGINAQDIYALVTELSEFSNICLCLTSRISTIPPTCKTLDIPVLSIEAARDTFYRIYGDDKQSNLVDNILQQLDFHPLSITLLATVAHHNKWDTGRLIREWGGRRIDVLRTRHNNSLAATIELSLASPMFRELGPDARELLGIIAFFPQGIDEKNLDWLFPDISNRTNVFDDFCVLSLAYRTNGFVTMLAPLRDYLCPKDPASSPLLNATKDRYFTRLSVTVDPEHPGFEEARWITSEDVNVEHLLDVFISIDANSAAVWDACESFMRHLYWHKARPVVLGSKIEGLPDDHPSKPRCLFRLSGLFGVLVNCVEQKRLLVYTLKLYRERGDDFRVAETLRFISDADNMLGVHKEGIERAKEALEIYKRLNNIAGQAQAWQRLAKLFHDSKQLNAAEEAASRAIDLLSETGQQFPVSECHLLLGRIYRSKGETEKSITHFETALEIAAPHGWHGPLFWINYSLAGLLFDNKKFDDAHVHVGRAKSYAINDTYRLGCAMELQAGLWYKQRRFEEAKSEALGAASAYEKIGAAKEVERCKVILRNVEKATNKPAASTHK